MRKLDRDLMYVSVKHIFQLGQDEGWTDDEIAFWIEAKKVDLLESMYVTLKEWCERHED